MNTQKKMLRYVQEQMQEVCHTTLNPEGPGVVRIHMIPPTIIDNEVGSSVAIVNGQDILPINPSWSILLSIFMKEVNQYSGHEVSQADTDLIMKNTCKGMRKIFPFLSKKIIQNDVYRMMTAFTQVARGEIPEEGVEYLNIGEYAPFMRAPHRMDLLISAMEKNGQWHCNQKCVHCYAAGQHLAAEEELDTASWKKIIDKCRAAGIPQVTFTGGEPTMREDLVELVDYSKWFVTRLNTNGIKLTPELCEKLSNASLDSMQITFYSCDEAVHNELVGAAQYQNTVAGIENALKAGINVSINTPLCTLNKDYVKTLEFLHEKGVLYVTCSGLITTGNATESASTSLQLSHEEMEQILRDAVDYCFANGMEISFTSPGWVKAEVFEELGISTPSCGACLSNMAVTPGGTVVPCQSYLSEDGLGNMLTDEWESIWNNPKTMEHRNNSAQMLGTCPLRREK